LVVAVVVVLETRWYGERKVRGSIAMIKIGLYHEVTARRVQKKHPTL
jgi:hypothetical protein